MRRTGIFLSLAVGAFLMAVTRSMARAPYQATGSISIDLMSVSAGVGAVWGKGILRFQGKRYRFKITGLDVGNIGVAAVTAVGNVYNMSEVSQFPGRYGAVGAEVKLAGGIAGLKMQNNKSVIILMYALQKGVQLNVSPHGFDISME
jgi:hypothetical protein